MCHITHVEVRGQTAFEGSFFFTDPKNWNSGHEVWWQVPFLAETSYPRTTVFYLTSEVYLTPPALLSLPEVIERVGRTWVGKQV